MHVNMPYMECVGLVILANGDENLSATGEWRANLS